MLAISRNQKLLQLEEENQVNYVFVVCFIKTLLMLGSGGSHS